MSLRNVQATRKPKGNGVQTAKCIKESEVWVQDYIMQTLGEVTECKLHNSLVAC